MGMRALLVATAILAGVSASSPASASVTVYTDYYAWAAAAGGSIVTEDFTHAGLTASGLTVTSDNGEITHTSVTFGDAWRDVVVPGGATTTWKFSSPTYAFGGFWDLQSDSVGGPGTGIDLYLDGLTNVASVDNSLAGVFFGFVSDTAFTSVQERAGQLGGVSETYEVSPIVFASAVPEPSTWAMLMLGFAGVGFMAYRRRLQPQFG